jgi:hypothetical protein
MFNKDGRKLLKILLFDKKKAAQEIPHCYLLKKKIIF